MSIGEQVGDVETGAQSELSEGGLTAEEKAAFDAMQRGDAGPSEIEAGQAGDEGDIDPEPDGDDGQADPEHVSATTDKDPTQDGQQPRQTPKTISYGKYQREQRKAAEKADKLAAELDTERQQRVRLDERTRMLMEAINAKQPVAAAKVDEPVEAEDPEPNGEEDFVAHAAWTARELKRTQDIVKKIDGRYTQDREQTTAQNEEQRVYNTLSADLERAAKADPEYADAFVHLRESRFTELGFVFAGIDINDPEQCKTLTPEAQAKLSDDIQRAFYADQMEVARAAIKANRSPADSVRNLARARGFSPKAKVAATETNGKVPPIDGKAPAIAAKPAAVKDQLAAIREGQAASTSLSDAGGSPGGAISPERLAAMSDDEFTEYYDSMSKGQFDRVALGKPANA